MDVSNICRSCMKEVSSWERENFNSSSIENMFSYCTKIELTEEDNLPRQFCYNCIVKIESSYTFIIEAQKVNVTLKDIISRAITRVIVKQGNSTKNAFVKTELSPPEYKLSTSEGCCEQILILGNENYDDLKWEEESKDDETDVDLKPKDEIKDDETDVDLKPKGEIKDDETDVDLKPKGEIKDEEIPEHNNKTESCRKQVCRKTFTSKTRLDKHKKICTRPKYSCSHCAQTFTKPSLLKKHTPRHSNERTHACSAPNCSKRFKTKKDLANHTRRHVDFRPFACDLCSMRFKEKNVLKGHMKVHEASKDFVCNYCGWSFAHAGNLTVHMRIHTGERPFACSDCDFKSASPSNLRRHQRTHTEIGTHGCNTCSKTFNDATGLVRHMRTHTGELPYHCPSCPRAFIDSWKRKTHLMRSHHFALEDIPRMRRDGTTLSLAVKPQKRKNTGNYNIKKKGD